MLVTSSLSMTSSFLLGLVDLLPALLDSRSLRSLLRLSSSGFMLGLSRTELSELRRVFRSLSRALGSRGSANMSSLSRGACWRLLASLEFEGRCPAGWGNPLSDGWSDLCGPLVACLDLVFCKPFCASVISSCDYFGSARATGFV